MVSVSQTSLSDLEASLLNTSGTVSLHERFRTLFTLKAIDDDRVVNIIGQGFKDSSALLKHELAYVLGQRNDPKATPILTSVLSNLSEDPMVRHEAAEALGAISDPSALPLLRQYLKDPERAVRETCEIAIAKIEWDNSEEGRLSAQNRKEDLQFTSIDPAPPSKLISGTKQGTSDVAALRDTLMDRGLPLFQRYRAMFALRNIGTNEAVDALACGFGDDSALFRHEIAFVFGQLQSPHSISPLTKVLENTAEEDMVRHEAAEALGGIGTQEVLPTLRKWRDAEDSPRVVRESCIVALDMWEYENSDQFQYANGLGGAHIPVSA